MNDRIEIRMLGRLFVRRADGDVVDAEEWSTGKTTDLLRLLALNANRPVSVTGILDKLWPDVDEVKARASLRTAASRVRRALGSDCIDRHLGGLVLRGVWVDVVAFQTIVNEAKAAMRAQDFARVVTLAREAEGLYVADFRAHDDKSVWATDVRGALKMSRQLLLADAAESAVQLLWMRDAIDFAMMAIVADPCFERPHRSLIRAHAGLGEIELALRAFEHCRVNLSQELGADPSPQTRALHIEILSGDFDESPVVPFTGRKDEVESLALVIAESIASDGCDVVCLTGPEGSGRESLLQAAVARVRGAHLLRLADDVSSTAVKLARTISQRRSDVLVWGPVDGFPGWEMTRLNAFLAALDPDKPRVIAVVTSEKAGDMLAVEVRDSPLEVHRISTWNLSDPDLATIAGTVLSGAATLELLRVLRAQSGGLAGRAVTILREWIASGRIISTASGLDLYNDDAALAGTPPVGDHFRMLLEQVSPQEMEFCQLLAVIDRPVSARTALFVEGLDEDNPAAFEEVQSMLDALSDLGILRLGDRGYGFRNRAIRDSFESWLRPAVKARLLRQIGDAFGDETDLPVESVELGEARLDFDLIRSEPGDTSRGNSRADDLLTGQRE